MIEVENLSKTFFVRPKAPGLWGSVKNLIHSKPVAKVALHSVSFTMRPGEFIGLIGANGAGKTTLVKMLAGIIYPTSGQARVLGHTPSDRPNELRKKIALIMGQKTSLWWDLPALDCFLLLKEIYQISDADYKERLEELTDLLQVGHVLTTPIRNLSLGERMKMELMACLLHRPEIIFLDEPTIGLDITSQKRMREFLQGYSKKFKPLIILTSHYMQDIDELCKRALILKRGQLVYDGGIDQLKDKLGQDKVLRLQLSEGRENLPVPPMKVEIKKCSPFEWEIKSAKENAAALASWSFQNLPIHDFTLDEADLGDVIEKVFSQENF